jgi:rhodanese-related sulfurtransferase
LTVAPFIIEDYIISQAMKKINTIQLSKLILEGGLILTLSILSGFLFNSLSDEGIPLSTETIDIEPGSDISTEETYRIFLEGQALFLDARYKEEFVEGHIKNALNLPSRASRDEIETFLENMPKDRLIITYCSNPLCNSSRRLAGLLMYLGYKNVLVSLDGYDKWLSYNYPKQVGE